MVVASAVHDPKRTLQLRGVRVRRAEWRAGPQRPVSPPREFRGMELHEVGHARRDLAGELEVVLAHLSQLIRH
jgi:hypothetical protein